MEIPKKIRYDVLLILLGFAFIVVPFYFKMLEKLPVVAFAMLTSGLIMLAFGLGHIKYDYDLEMDLKELEYVITKNTLIKKLQHEKLLSADSKDAMLRKLKDLLKRR